MSRAHHLTGYSMIACVTLLALSANCSRDSDLVRVEWIESDKRIVGTVKNGKKHGEWLTLVDGQPWEVEHWRDGLLHGPYYERLQLRGSMTMDGAYYNGLSHGRTRIFYAPFRLAELGWYEHGREERTWCRWDPDGSLEYIKIFQKGRLIREDLDPPGQCPLVLGEGKRHLDPGDKNYE